MPVYFSDDVRHFSVASARMSDAFETASALSAARFATGISDQSVLTTANRKPVKAFQ
jgi:hypothetical protein